MFFQNLFPVARHTPLSIIVTPNGTQLSVIVTPKPTGDAEDNPALGNPIKIIGTPEELDKELPDALRTYAEKVNDVRTKIDLPIEALDAAAVKGKKKGKAKTDSEANPTPRATAAKKSVQRAKKAAKTRATKTSKKITPPGSPATPSRPRASLPGKPECLADLKELFPKLGRHPLVRRLAHVDPQALFELVAPLAVHALGEMCLRLILLLLGEDMVEVRLHHLLAVRAGVHHVASSRADSASSRFRMRRPRWSLDITVPTGMSRIWAASA